MIVWWKGSQTKYKKKKIIKIIKITEKLWARWRKKTFNDVSIGPHFRFLHNYIINSIMNEEKNLRYFDENLRIFENLRFFWWESEDFLRIWDFSWEGHLIFIWKICPLRISAPQNENPHGMQLFFSPLFFLLLCRYSPYASLLLCT